MMELLATFTAVGVLEGVRSSAEQVYFVVIFKEVFLLARDAGMVALTVIGCKRCSKFLHKR